VQLGVVPVAVAMSVVLAVRALVVAAMRLVGAGADRRLAVRAFAFAFAAPVVAVHLALPRRQLRR